MRVIGLFRELVWPENARLPSIHASKGALAEDMVMPVLMYLSMGTDVIDVMEATRDPFDHAKYISGGPSLTTDGEWVWRYDLEHYVRLYRLGLPEEFLARVRRVQTEPVQKMSVKEVISEVLDTYRAAEGGDPRAVLY